jgi:hypothetical protein
MVCVPPCCGVGAILIYSAKFFLITFYNGFSEWSSEIIIFSLFSLPMRRGELGGEE